MFLINEDTVFTFKMLTGIINTLIAEIRRIKREKKKRTTSVERRERERSASTRKNSNDRDGKDKVEKNNTSLKVSRSFHV